MKLLKPFFLYAFIAGLAYLIPCETFGLSEIEFYVTNNTNNDKCFQCTGPFSRITPRVNVAQNGGMTYFYTAAVTAYSPYGHWLCSVYVTDNCLDDGPIPDEDTFSTGIVIPGGSAVVDLSISEVQGLPVINVNFPGIGTTPNGNEVSVSSMLGNDPLPDTEDRDTFRIRAEEGDQVTIRLDGDPTAGHIGSFARLRLTSGRRIGQFRRVEKGELPLEITVTIPEAGTYEVTVAKLAQSDVPDNLLSFKGGYILSVSSAGDKIEALIPGENVEH